MLDAKTRKYLRGLAHELKPTVIIGKDGITEAVIREIIATAGSLELVKIKINPNAPVDAREAEQQLAPDLPGEFVGHIGRILIYFQQKPEDSRYLGQK